MPIKYNNFDIGNAYLGNDNLVAMYQGSNLVWTNGIKLTSLLGKQNVETLKESGGFYKCHTDNTWKENYNSEETSKITTLNTAHKYCCIIHSTDVSNGEYEYGNIAYKENAFAWASVSNVGLYRDKGYISISFNCSDERVRFGYMGNVGATIYSQVVIDLTKAKLDTLSAEQLYNLLTLNGTDFTNLELLSAGYEIKLGSFKSQDKLIEGGLSSETAQFYYDLFFSTLGMSKMYVPYGKRFESSDNIILGTKYGIVDLGDVDWYIFQSGDNWCATSNFINNKTKVYGGSEIPNIYINGYSANGYWYSINDKEVRIDTEGHDLYIWDSVFIEMSNEQVKTYLKGKYLIYELSTPNGTNYNDLTAKQMYDLINDNAIELLANGKTIGGITNLYGKQNIPLTIDGSTRNILTPTQSGSFYYWDTSVHKGISVIKDHKYFVCFYGNFQDSVPDSIIIQDKNNDYSTLAEIYQVVSKDGSWYFDFKKAYGGSFISSVSTNGAVVENRYWSGWNQFFTDGDIIEGLIVIDLTINNLQDKTDREVYTMLKEKHLFDLTTSGEIKLGGI